MSTLTTTFNGPAATLALKIPNAFLATIGGLAAGDTIDLLTLPATGASANGSDQLVLSGNDIGATFTTKADGHGGANVEPTAAIASLSPTPAGALLGRNLPTDRPSSLASPLVQVR